MFWFFLFGAITVLVAIYLAIECFRDGEGLLFAGVFVVTCAFGAVFSMLFGMIFNIAGAGIAGYHQVKFSESSIIALQDGSSTSGSFFLGSGSIDSDPVFFYYEDDNGTYRLKHVLADDASVIESSGPARVDIYKNKANSELFGLPFSDDTTYIFYVPNGSILRNFALDAK